MVWPVTSELFHSTVSPAWMVILGRMNRISDALWMPPGVETSSHPSAGNDHVVVRMGICFARIVGIIFSKLSSQSTVMVGKQVTLLIGSLGVVEVLIVRKRLRRV